MIEKTVSTKSIERKYEKACQFMQGILSKSIAFNTTLYPVWIDDSDCFWYERDSRSGKEYRLVDAALKCNKVAFDHSLLASALEKVTGESVDANNLPITKVDVTLSDSVPDKTIKSISFFSFEKNWIFDVKSGCCLEKDVICESWVVSPDGGKAIFVRDCNLWMREIESGEEHALTDDGEECFAYGAAGSAWGYSSGFSAQARWSPDSTKIFTVQRDTRLVRELPVVHHVPQGGSLRPYVRNYKVAFPGDTQRETLRLISIEVASGKIQEANYRRIPTGRNNIYGFFATKMGWWSNDGRLAYFIDMEDDCKTARLIEFDTFNGNTVTLFEESSLTTLNFMSNDDDLPMLVPLPESKELLWYSERSGWGSSLFV